MPRHYNRPRPAVNPPRRCGAEARAVPRDDVTCKRSSASGRSCCRDLTDVLICGGLRSTSSWPGRLTARRLRPDGSSPAGTSRRALALERDDDEMDRLQQDIFTMPTDGTWKYGTETAATRPRRVSTTSCSPTTRSQSRRVAYLVRASSNPGPIWTTGISEATQRHWSAMTANGDRTRGRSPGIWLRLEACSVRKPIPESDSQGLIVGVQLEAFRRVRQGFPTHRSPHD